MYSKLELAMIGVLLSIKNRYVSFVVWFLGESYFSGYGQKEKKIERRERTFGFSTVFLSYRRNMVEKRNRRRN